MKWLELWAYRHADGITAVTEGIQQTLLNAEKISDQKVFFLPNGVDLTLFEQPDIQVNSRLISKKNVNDRENINSFPMSIRSDVFAELKLSQDKFLFIYPGNLGNAHSLETILEVASHLQQDARNFHFLF